jgi:hypothetical protein
MPDSTPESTQRSFARTGPADAGRVVTAARTLQILRCMDRTTAALVFPVVQ